MKKNYEKPLSVLWTEIKNDVIMSSGAGAGESYDNDIYGSEGGLIK